MSFLFPLGFLALIGIPVLIFIYIIKNRYTEQTVTSTYLWTLSEKFLKRRIPINRLTGILSLILQILTVIAVALILAHPIITVPDSAEAYCFVIDGSGSMNIVQNGETRFDTAKKEIVNIIDDSMLGSSYTYICAGDTAARIFENDTDKSHAASLVEKSTVSYTSSTLTDALRIAQDYFEDVPYAKIYLLTDKDFENVQNVEVINVAEPVENYAISDVVYDLGEQAIKGKVTSYTGDVDELTVEVYLDGSGDAARTETVRGVDEEGKSAPIKKLEATEFSIDCKDFDFADARVRIAQKDVLDMDNEVVIYKLENQNFEKTLLISERPFFMTRLLNAVGLYDRSATDVGEDLLDVIEPSAYSGPAGYGLYIFDSLDAEFINDLEMPGEGAVWIINPRGNFKNSNFSYQGEVVRSDYEEEDPDVQEDDSFKSDLVGVFPDKTGRSSVVDEQLKGIPVGINYHLRRYSKLSVSGKYYELSTCDGNPVIFSGTNAYGNREAVFAFDLHEAGDLVLSGSLVLLVNNLISYSFPQVVNNTLYYCGDTLQINMITDCRSVRIETPSGSLKFPDTSSAVSEYVLDEVGTYKIYLVMKDESERLLNVWSSLPLEERNPVEPAAASFTISGTPSEAHLDGLLDNLLIIFIVLAVIVVADYGVYCYEQYQLR